MGPTTGAIDGWSPVDVEAGRKDRLLGVALVLMSAVGFGLMPVLARIAYNDGVNAPTLLALRFSLASVIMWPWVVRRGYPIPNGELRWHVLWLGAIGYVAQSITFFTAVRFADVSVVASVAYVYPILVVVIAWITGRDFLSILRLTCVGAAVIGTVLMVGPSGEARMTGVLLALGAAAIYSVYFTLTELLIPRGFGSGASVLIFSVAGATFWLIVLIGGVFDPPDGATGWMATVGLTVSSTVIAITALITGLQRLRPITTAVIASVEPVVSVTLAVLILGETFSLSQSLGLLLVLVSVVVLMNPGVAVVAQITRGPTGMPG